MPRFVTLYQFTDQGIRNVKESPMRLKAGIKAAESMGMTVIAAYYTQGPYDVLVISEAADENIGNAFALSIASQGNVRSTTMRAYDADEFDAILKLIR